MNADYQSFYINGEWVRPDARPTHDVINPATEQPFTQISMGTAEDVDAAVRAARQAFPGWSTTSVEERQQILGRIVDGIKARAEELAQAISQEMGAPIGFARSAQVGTGIAHFATARQILANYPFEEARGTTQVLREPIGVCGLITPWNWPLNQVACKVAPALATGCTMVIKPSEMAPVSAMILAEIIHDAGVPAGVFNLVNGDGQSVGTRISSHPDIDMVSFTGSTRAGQQVAIAAAPTIKRVSQELGGKSANIILDDADFPAALKGSVFGCFGNAGQSCNAPTRMLVPQARMQEVIDIVTAVASKAMPGNPADEATRIGPVSSQAQFDKVQGLIQQGVDEGATLIAGGPGRPTGLDTGYYVRPTVFANVTNDMTIAREEIFGPVLVIIGYQDDDDAVRIANDSVYGLSGYVWGSAPRAREVARRLRTGMVHLNGAAPDFNAPFGGYKQSGNGREWGIEGFHEFLEIKAIMGHNE